MRFTQKKLYNHIGQFIAELETNGIKVDRAILFGSYASGKANSTSDIDLAIWSVQFSDDAMEEREKMRSLLQKYTPLSVHPYPKTETAVQDPFISVIESTGKRIV
jgi:predicted nucleotidyltransferase